MGQSQAIIQHNQMEQLEESIIQTFLLKNKYQYQKVLGKGDFSQVVMAFSQKNQCQVAIKILKKLKDKNQVDLQDFEKEFQVLQKLKNEKYVLQIVEKIQDDKQGLAAIVTELCDCNLTTIFELNTLNIEQVVALSYQLLKGLLVLQENGIIHSDIKPDNILFSKSKNQFLIADYGLSKIVKEPSSQKTSASLQGNIEYKSPEVMNRQKPYTIAVDVFSIGQLLVEAYIQRRLLGMEWLNLKSQNLLTVLPSLQNSPNIEFVNKVLCKMVEPKKENRLLPMTLLQNIKSLFAINENSLKQLKVQIELPTEPQKQLNVQIEQPKESPKKFKRLEVYKISDIIKGKDYDELVIDLSQNNIGDDGAKSVANAIQNCQQITSLTLGLYQNNIGGDGAKSVANAIQNCKQITSLTLDLRGNKIGDDGAKSVANAILNCQQITVLKLYLYSNNIGGDGAKSVANAIQNCKQITSLSLGLGQNNIGDDGAKSVANAIQNCQQITSLTLGLNYNNIGDDGAKSVANAIQNCKQITSLGLGLVYNNIGDDGAKSVANAIQNCKQITYLDLRLRSNKIGDDGAKSVANAIQNCKQITSLTLYLRWNKIAEISIMKLERKIKKILRLVNVDLSIEDQL